MKRRDILWALFAILFSLFVLSQGFTILTQSDWDQGLFFNGTAANTSDVFTLAHTNYSELGRGISSSGMVLLLHLNNESNENNAFAYDFSGQINNATCTNCPRFNSTGKIRGAFEFDGSNDEFRVETTGNSELDPAAVTFSLWARLAQLSNNQDKGILCRLGTGNCTYGIAWNDDGSNDEIVLYFKTAEYNNSLHYSISSLSTRWYHVAATFSNANNGSVVLYLDGTNVSSWQDLGQNLTYSSQSSDDLTLGSDGQSFSNGFIDEVAVWNRNLSASEISSIFQIQKDSYPSKGSYESRIFDATNSSIRWFNLTFSGTRNLGFIGIQVRSCDDGACSGELFVGSQNATAAYFNDTPIVLDQNLTPNNRYFQFRIFMNTTDRNYTPSIDGINMSYRVEGGYVYLTDNDSANFTAVGSIDGILANGSYITQNQSLNFSNPDYGKRVILFAAFAQGNVNLDQLIIQATNNKTLLELGSVTGIAGNHTLFVPIAHNVSLVVCPSATLLAHINDSCAGKIRFLSAEAYTGTTKSGIAVSVEGDSYRIDNLAGSGAGEGDSTLLDINSNASVPSSPTESQLTYIYANVTSTEEIFYVNFTVFAPNGTAVINNTNASAVTGDFWNSSSFFADSIGTWTWNITAASASLTVSASGSFTVNAWQILVGNISGSLSLSGFGGTSIIYWAVPNTTGSNIYVSDYDSSISFTDLLPLGKNLSNDTRREDFAELDAVLGTTNDSDSVNHTFTSAGSLVGEHNFTLFSVPVYSVPIVNSTSLSAFVTGILWDTSDDSDGNYDASEDILFITEVQTPQPATYGFYSFEIRVPATLRSYISGGDSSSVALYGEIK